MNALEVSRVASFSKDNLSYLARPAIDNVLSIYDVASGAVQLFQASLTMRMVPPTQPEETISCSRNADDCIFAS